MVSDDNDLYLSDVDDIAKSTVDKPTTGSQSTKGCEPAVELFPHSPKKIKPSKIVSKKVEPWSNADSTEVDVDFYVRKKSNRGRHPSNPRKDSSNSRDKRPSNPHENRDKRSSHDKNRLKSHDKCLAKPLDARPSKDLKNQARQHREKSEHQLKSVIVKAKERLQQRSRSKRIVELFSPICQPNNPPKRPFNRPQSQPTSTITTENQRSVFVRLEQPFRIPKINLRDDQPKPKEADIPTKPKEADIPTKPKEFATIGSQTELSGPYRCATCTKRTQIKNRNRRDQAKLNRDLVKRFNKRFNLDEQ